MKAKKILPLMIAMVLAGCSNSYKVKDHNADVSYAKNYDLSSDMALTSAEEDSAMFPVAQLPKKPFAAPSLLPPGSLKQHLHKIEAETQSSSMPAAQAAPSLELAKQATGDQLLLVQHDLGTAWGKIGRALQKGGLHLLAQDQKLGVYYAWQKNRNAEGGSRMYQVKLKKHDKHVTQVLLTDEHNHALPPSDLKRLQAIVASA